MARLGDTDLDVFPLCLGANVFGWTIDEDASFEVLDAYVAAGGNFIDTADIYGRRGEHGLGSSERIIGRWIASRKNRAQLIIATKIGMGPELSGLSAETIKRGAEASLERLGIERIDLYYAHRDDLQTPIEETLRALAGLIEEGVVGHVAASNYSPARLTEAIELGKRHGLASYVALQPHYNLMERGEYEGELAAVAEANDLACIPYFALARGFLTGKYRREGAEVQSQRAEGVRDSYMNDRGFAVLDVLDQIAAAHDSTPAAISLAWLLAQRTVLAPIASATSPGQLAEQLECVEIKLSTAELDALAAASA